MELLKQCIREIYKYINMKTFRIICLLACLVILGYHVYDLDYHDLGFKNNKNHYFSIFLMLMLSIGNLLSIIGYKKSKE